LVTFLYQFCCSSSLSILPSAVFLSALRTTAVFTRSLHDALPISSGDPERRGALGRRHTARVPHDRHQVASDLDHAPGVVVLRPRSEEHTSELQSRENLVCRLLLEKKKKNSFPDILDIEHAAIKSL